MSAVGLRSGRKGEATSQEDRGNHKQFFHFLVLWGVNWCWWMGREWDGKNSKKVVGKNEGDWV